MPIDTDSDEVKNSLEWREKLARQEMQDKIKQHLELNTLTINTISFVLGSSSPISFNELKQSSKVVFMLLNRMSNDIRTAGLLSWNGYTMQAAAVIADCYESSFTIMYLGSDDSLGQAWIDHQDPSCTPFGKVSSVTEEGLKKRNVQNVQEQTEVEYNRYRQLCWAKHGNPILQKLHGLRVERNQIGVFNGPDTSEEAMRLAAWVLELAAHLAYLALTSFVDHHRHYISREKIPEILRSMKVLGATKEQAATASVQRWGDKDPFPGKWKKVKVSKSPDALP